LIILKLWAELLSTSFFFLSLTYFEHLQISSPHMSDTMTKTPQDLQIAILGAGMGGLTSALALAQQGFKNIEVFESASDLGFVGAGIQLAPNMARVLDGLGVWKGIEAEAVNIEETSVRGGSPQ
jgi:ribulose 1,5-bisphosphate synthetase/thiazole synthase